MDFLLLFDLYIKGFFASRTIACMRTGSARQADVCLAMGAFAVNVRLAVFPLIALQQNFTLDGLSDTKIFAVFFRTFCDLSGKHAVKHENTNGKGRAV